jgi:hypothetical protein
MKIFIIVFLVIPLNLCSEVVAEKLFSYSKEPIKFTDIDKSGKRFIVTGSQGNFGGIVALSGENIDDWEITFNDLGSFDTYIPDFELLQTEYFEDGRTYMVADRGIIFRSDNFGVDFDTIDLGLNCQLRDFKMFDRNTGICNYQSFKGTINSYDSNCINQSIYYTTDGWDNFIEIQTPATYNSYFVEKIQKVNELFIFLLSHRYLDGEDVKFEYSILKTNNLGVDWAVLPLKTNLFEIHFIDENIATGIYFYSTALGDIPEEKIYYTENGGQDWYLSDISGNAGGKFLKLFGYKDSTLILSSTHYNLLISKNLGKSWDKIDLKIPSDITFSQINDLEFIDANTMIAVTLNMVLKIDLLTSSVEVIHGPKTPGIYVENGRGSITTNLNLSDLSVSLYTLEGQKINLRNINVTASGIEFSLPHSISPGAYVMELVSGDKKEFFRILHSGF